MRGQSQGAFIRPYASQVSKNRKLAQPRPQVEDVGYKRLQNVVPLRIRTGPSNEAESFDFPSFWLRDHCHCPQCRHPETKQRLLDTFAIPRDINVAQVVQEEAGVHITWDNDSHQSYYPTAWLQKHSFATQPLPPREWVSVDPQAKATFPEVEYEEVMQSEAGVAKWTRLIYLKGFSFVNNVPITPDATKQLLERIAFIRTTHYGGFWDFTSDLSSKDTAYTTLGLPLHTDTTYFTDPCGLQLFHLLSHTSPSQQREVDLGGHNTMCDGYKAAEHLKKNHNWAYNCLTQIAVPYHSSGNEDVSISPAFSTRVIGEGTAQNDYQIRWNNDDRGTKDDWKTSHQMEQWYDAARLWSEIIKSKNFLIETSFEPSRALSKSLAFLKSYGYGC